MTTVSALFCCTIVLWLQLVSLTVSLRRIATALERLAKK